MTLAQIQKLLSALEGHRLETLFTLALATGMRRGELLGLKWQDIDLTKGKLQVRRVLTRIPSKMPGICTSLGTPLNPTRDVLDLLKAFFLKKEDLPNIHFHDLRHSAAALLLSLGVHPKVVQEILGHSQITMTMDIYSHVLPSMHEQAMHTLNEAIGKNQQDGQESTFA